VSNKTNTNKCDRSDSWSLYSVLIYLSERQDKRDNAETGRMPLASMPLKET